MSNPNDELEIRYEMKVALFWRRLLGDLEYVKFNPDDLFRWYEALELRGPDEIRTLKTERYFTDTHGVMQGVVARAPHPPLQIVNTWLENYEQRVHTGGYWLMAGCFVVMSGMVFSGMQGCVALTPMDPLLTKPPSGTLAVAPYVQPSTMALGNQNEGATTTQPLTAMLPATPTSAPPATPTATGPTSGGIAGAASGVAPATGITGGQNVGASAGMVQSGPSTAPP